MSSNPLLTHPLYKACDLGKPLPDSEHANSVCLPRWSDIIGYEEGDPDITSALQLGYPRFVFHPFVERAFEMYKPAASEACHIYQTLSSAERCKAFLSKRYPEHEITCEQIDGYTASLISFPKEIESDAKEFWQHTGEGISSRFAQALTGKRTVPDAATERNRLVDRICKLNGVDKSQVFLFSCGMSAIYAIYRACSAIFPERKSAQFSFPYSDTLKLLQKFGKGARFYTIGDDDCFNKLAEDLKSEPTSSIFCEFPTNPLLKCVDLNRLESITSNHDFPLIVDDTIGSYANVDLLSCADVVVTSLTKFFSGSGDVMGGAVIINPDSKLSSELVDKLKETYEPDAYCSFDIIEMEKSSRDYIQRMEEVNNCAEKLCDYLSGHSKVKSVHYPKTTGIKEFNAVKQPRGGYGGVFSLVLNNAEEATPKFYDSIQLCKGPNLGTTFTLCCPFTMLAHYGELEFAESCGASRYLVRFSVGLEGFEELKSRFDAALELV